MLSREELHVRAALFRTIRDFFSEQEFLEVDTPIRQPVILPEANILPVPAEGAFLQASPEQYMKRLLARGLDRIFQICRCFRKGERGGRHLEEFTMLEWYRVGGDYFNLMDDCQQLVRHCLTELAGLFNHNSVSTTSFFKSDSTIIFQPWPKTTVADAFAGWSPVSLAGCLEAGDFDEVLVEYVEPHLGQGVPEFLYDYPSQMASLARKKESDESLAERFELYYNGVELANGFSELTDSVEQRRRFEQENRLIFNQTGEQRTMPEKFLADLKKLNDCAGIAFGVDRFFMLMLGKENIAEAVSFSPDDM